MIDIARPQFGWSTTPNDNDLQFPRNPNQMNNEIFESVMRRINDLQKDINIQADNRFAGIVSHLDNLKAILNQFREEVERGELNHRSTFESIEHTLSNIAIMIAGETVSLKSHITELETKAINLREIQYAELIRNLERIISDLETMEKNALERRIATNTHLSKLAQSIINVEKSINNNTKRWTWIAVGLISFVNVSFAILLLLMK